MEQGKISSRQLGLLAVVMVFSTGVMFLPAISGKEARQDVWLSSLLVTAFAVPVGLLVASLARRLSGEGALRTLLGSVLGRMATLILVWFAIHTAALVAREFGALMVASLMPETPISIFIAIQVWMACIMARNGIETIARVNEFWLPILLVTTFVIIILVVKQANWHLLLPVLEYGWGPVLRGAYAPAAWVGETITLLYAAICLNRPDQGKRALVGGLVGAGLLLTIGGVINVVVLGPGQIGRQFFPTLTLSRLVEVARFISRIESITMLLWLVGTMVKLAVFIHAAAVGLAQVVRLPRYTSLVLPLGTLVAALAVGMFPNISSLVKFLAEPWPGWALTVELGLPVLMFAIAWVAGRRRQRPRQSTGPPPRAQRKEEGL